MKKIRVGIIGTGFTIGIAASHIRGYQDCKDTELVACYDEIPGRAQLFLDKHGVTGVRACNSLDELFSLVDAISICVPNVHHVAIAATALEAGKHILVEKPLANNAEAGAQILKCAQAHPELVSMCVFNYRERSEYQYMKEIVESGVLGKITLIRHHSGGSRMSDGENVYLEWRMQESEAGSGSLADFGAHMLDLTEWIAGSQIGSFRSVSSQVSTIFDSRYPIDLTSITGEKASSCKEPVTNDDSAAFSAITESGALCSFVTSRMNFSGTDFEICGTNGCISSSSKWPAGFVGMALKDRPVPGQGKITLSLTPVKIPEKYCGHGTQGLSHYGLICEFADCILNGKKPTRDIARGLQIQQQIDRFVQAAKKA